MMDNQFDLDAPLFQFGSGSNTYSYTVQQSFQHCLVMGSTGSGKTSTSFRVMATGYLRENFGGLILTAKPDELKAWIQLCEETGRINDLIIVSPSYNNTFNWLEFVSSSKSETAYTENVFQILKTVLTASENKSQKGEKDEFWESAINQLIMNTIDVCILAYDKVTVQSLYDIARTAPKKYDPTSSTKNANKDRNDSAFQTAMRAAKGNVKAQIDEWLSTTYNNFEQLSDKEYDQILGDEIPAYRTLKMVTEFFTETLFDIPEKTRSLVTFSFANFLARLLREPLYSLFNKSKPSTFTPEDCYNGKLIIIQLPVKIYQKVGQDAQILMKLIFQKCWETRNIEEHGRPLFIISDESHLFSHPLDSDFQSTARSSRISVTAVTQNLANLYLSYGENPEYKVATLIGNFVTKIWHANVDMDTNRAAESLIGRAYVEDNSRTIDITKDFNMSNSTGYVLENIVRAESFVSLLTGGRNCDYKVHAYIHMQGKPFKNGFNHMKICFNQKPII